MNQDILLATYTKMTATEVRALVAAMYPGVLESPLAQAMRDASSASDHDRVMLLADARRHGLACIDACGGWTVETLGHNIQSNFPELDADECDQIASGLLNSPQ